MAVLSILESDQRAARTLISDCLIGFIQTLWYELAGWLSGRIVLLASIRLFGIVLLASVRLSGIVLLAGVGLSGIVLLAGVGLCSVVFLASVRLRGVVLLASVRLCNVSNGRTCLCR